MSTPQPERCYLSGPMTGLPEFNYPRFHEAAASLREQGYDMVNPAENHGGRTDLGRHAYFRADLPQVAQCQNLFLLPGWRASRGVRYELIVAEACGLRVFELEGMPVLGALGSGEFFRAGTCWYPAYRMNDAMLWEYTRFNLDPDLFPKEGR